MSPGDEGVRSLDLGVGIVSSPVEEDTAVDCSLGHSLAEEDSRRHRSLAEGVVIVDHSPGLGRNRTGQT